MSIELLSSLFLLLSGVMAVVVIFLLARYLEGRARSVAITSFIAWLIYTTLLGYRGILASKSPPGLVFVLFPATLFLVAFLMRHPSVRQFASNVPATWLIGLQVFRIFVEVALYELYLYRLVPRLMTFEGGNLDIVTGLLAPPMVWLYATRRIDDRIVRAWSWLGILLLTNIIARAFLTSTGLLKTEVPNTALGLFPFTYLPGFLAPLAMYLHVLLLRSLPTKQSA